MTPATPHPRLHALDALRAVAMLLGIALHAAIPYSTRPASQWAFRDPAAGPWPELLLFLIHAFRMHLFFLVAGLFSALLVRRLGVRGFALHRSRRILLTYLLGLLTLVPLMGLANNAARWLTTPAPPPLASALLGRAGPPFTGLLAGGDAHLWFLRFLIGFSALAAVAAAIASRRPALNLAARAAPLIDRWAASRWRPLAAAVVIAPVALLWQRGAPVALAGPPNLMLPVYLLYFIAGWLIGAKPARIPALLRGGRSALTLSPLAALAVFAAQPIPPLAAFLYTLLGLLLTLGLVGVFLRWCSRPSPAARFLADASFWMYLAHLPLVIILGALAVPLPLPAFVKFLLVSGLTSAALLTLYAPFRRRLAPPNPQEPPKPVTPRAAVAPAESA